jgi:hypothetical protein
MSDAQLSHHRPSTADGAGDSTAGLLSTLVYRSRAVRPLSETELCRLTMAAQARNLRESITGVMVYDDSHFFQWLEGPGENVDRVMDSIRGDSRHTDIEILNSETVRSRAFGRWSMRLATQGAKSPWSDDAIIEPPAAVLAHLRNRPDAAPAVLIKLVPDAMQVPSSVEQLKQTPLGRTTAVVLKDVILSTIVPLLTRDHGIGEPSLHRLPVNPRAAELAELLIATDQTAARQLIEELHSGHESIRRVSATLFEPAARSLGDLWAEDLCSDVDVTLGLCCIQTAVRLLSAHASPERGIGPQTATVLVAPEPGEFHRLGAALDSEVLRSAGWGPQCEYPADDRTLQDLVSSTWFDALDVSLSVAYRREDWLPRLTATIAKARKASKNPALVVVVGGRIFGEEKTFGLEVGADLSSATALNVDKLISRGIANRDAQPGSTSSGGESS